MPREGYIGTWNTKQEETMTNYFEMELIKKLCESNGLRVPQKVRQRLSKRPPQDLSAFDRHGMICLGTVSKALNVSPRIAGDILVASGYIRHPALDRSQGKIRMRGQLVKLYVKKGSKAAALVRNRDIVALFFEGRMPVISWGPEHL